MLRYRRLYFCKIHGVDNSGTHLSWKRESDTAWNETLSSSASRVHATKVPTCRIPLLQKEPRVHSLPGISVSTKSGSPGDLFAV